MDTHILLQNPPCLNSQKKAVKGPNRGSLPQLQTGEIGNSTSRKRPLARSDERHIGQSKLLHALTPRTSDEHSQSSELPTQSSNEVRIPVTDDNFLEAKSFSNHNTYSFQHLDTNSRYKDVFILVSMLDEPGGGVEMWSDSNIMSSMLEHTHILGR